MKTIIRVLVMILITVLCNSCEKSKLPQVYIGELVAFSQGAYCHAWVLSNGKTEVDEYGFAWSKSDGSDTQNSKIVFYNGTNYFETLIIGLSPNTNYLLKAYATNSAGTGSSEEEEITTSQTGTFTDTRDNKTYRWVEIGNLIWMAENLSYMPYISSFKSDSGIYVYNYKGSSVDEASRTAEFQKYGCLYSWEISLQVCPDGWHLPSQEEWYELNRSIGMTDYQISQYDDNNKYFGNMLKSTDWPGGNNNATLFSALPGGYHLYDYNPYSNLTSYFTGLGIAAYFWSSTMGDEVNDFPYTMNLGYYGLETFVASKNNGFSVRCVKDY